MLHDREFDRWAADYDDAVRGSDERRAYPFAGYAAVVDAIGDAVMSRAPARVLDIGLGTATLSARLYEANSSITGIDFSLEMLAVARAKMPAA